MPSVAGKVLISFLRHADRNVIESNILLRGELDVWGMEEKKLGI